MLEVDALPEIGYPLYDDTVSEAYQALETAYHMYQHDCDDRYDEEFTDETSPLQAKA